MPARLPVPVPGTIVPAWFLRRGQPAAFGHQLAGTDDADALGNAFRHFQDVRCQDHGAARSDLFKQNVLHRTRRGGIKPGERFIKDEQAWFVDERASQRQFLLHAARKAFAAAVALVPQGQALQQGFGARFGVSSRHVPQAGDEGQILDGCQLVVQQGLVGQPGDQALGSNRIGQRIHPEHADIPGVRAGEARNHPERCRLAGAIGAQQRIDLPGRHDEIEAIHSQKAVKGLGQAVDL